MATKTKKRTSEVVQNEPEKVETNSQISTEKIQTEFAAELAPLAEEIDSPLVQEIVPLNPHLALKTYSQEEKKDVLALSDEIDVLQIDKVMNYGSAAAQKTFEQCGEFLKKERGSTADQEVISQVIKLSKEAGQAKEDFNLVLQEPNLLQKIGLFLTTGGRNSHADKVLQSAVTNYQLIFSLVEYSEHWSEILKNAYCDIEDSGRSDLESAITVEKYIVAGELAKSRIEGEILAKEKEYQETGLQLYSAELKRLKQGYKTFLQTMRVLEKARVAYYISLGQLSLELDTNTNVQTVIHTQTKWAMTQLAQQLRNAVLNAHNKEVMEAQKSLDILNDKIIQDVSKCVGLSAKESEELITAAICDTEGAKKAIGLLCDATEQIRQQAMKNMDLLKNNDKEIENLLIKLSNSMDLAPALEENENAPVATATSATIKPASGGLKF